jgi:hypothetical protein
VINRAGTEDTVHNEHLGLPGNIARFSLESGDYTAQVVLPVRPDGQVFLSREQGTGSESVSARMVSDNPMPLTVQPGQTSDLTIQFELNNLVDLEFSVGDVQVHTSVAQGTGTVQERAYKGGGFCVLSSVNASGFTGQLSQLSSIPVNNGYDVRFELARTGEWAFNGEGVCVPVSANQASIAAEPLLASLMNEAVGGTGQLCVLDEAHGGKVTLSVYREGNLYDTSLRDDFAGDVWAGFGFEGTPSAPLFEKGTFHLTRLREPLRLSDSHVQSFLGDQSSPKSGGIDLLGVLEISVLF